MDVSADAFLALERDATAKHELVNGRVIAMAGASPRHVAVVANLTAALHLRLRGTACRSFASDLRVHVPATVVCGAIERFDKDSATILNPSALVEVLSESTEAYDRGAKFADYRSIPTLRSYVLVDHAALRIERFDRLDDADWRLHEAIGLDATIELPALAITLPLSEVFENLPEEPS
ncbi:MAG: Uma2 family endonuclease [Polyangiales bacterium]